MCEISEILRMFWIPFLNRFWLFRIQSFQEPAELLFGYLFCFFTGPGPLEASAFVSFVQKAEPISFIVNRLDSVCPSSAEQEQRIAVWIKFEIVLDDIHQSIQLFPHICVPSTDIDVLHMGEIS